MESRGLSSSAFCKASEAMRKLNMISIVSHSGIADLEPALNPAWRSPERPLLVPVEDAGPSPSLAFTAARGDIGGHPVPAPVLESHSGAAFDRVEAHLDLGSV